MVDPFIARDERWLLPEGIEELLPDQAEHLERLRRNLLDLFAAIGDFEPGIADTIVDA